MAKFLLLSLLLIFVTGIPAKPTLEPPTLLRSLQSKELSHADIILSMTEGNNIPSLFFSKTQERDFENRGEKLKFVTQILKNEADIVQKELEIFLEKERSARSVKVTKLWMTNQIILKGVDFLLMEKLMDRDDIYLIEQDYDIPLIDGTDLPQEDLMDNSPQATVQWGVTKIRAPEIWKRVTRGRNIVVASIDTGARVTHEAIENNYRPTYGWFDAIDFNVTPHDDHGHGTHTIGTIAGTTRGIGVAPGAEWIACRACAQFCTGTICTATCPMSAILQCAQWVLCPTDPSGVYSDCTKAPHVVSCSWGGGTGHDSIVAAWRQAGIIPVFSIGNNGPSCNTTGSPGNHPDVIGVGSTTPTDTVSPFSSLGPYGSAIKPDVAAPGSNILSAGKATDTEYVTLQGTSMACPHVSGLIALILSAYGEDQLNYDQVKDLLQRGALPITSSNGVCGGIRDTVYPNNHVGYGRVDAVNSVSLLAPIPTTTTTTTTTTTSTTAIPPTTMIMTTEESNDTLSSTTGGGCEGVLRSEFYLFVSVLLSFWRAV